MTTSDHPTHDQRTQVGIPYAPAAVDMDGYHVVCPICGAKVRPTFMADDDRDATKGALRAYQQHFAMHTHDNLSAYENACNDAASVQGLDPVVAALRSAGIPVEVEQTGGFVMNACVYRHDGPYLGITWESETGDPNSGYLVIEYRPAENAPAIYDDSVDRGWDMTVEQVVVMADQFLAEGPTHPDAIDTNTEDGPRRYTVLAHVNITVEADTIDAAQDLGGMALDVMTAAQWRDAVVLVDVVPS